MSQKSPTVECRGGREVGDKSLKINAHRKMEKFLQISTNVHTQNCCINFNAKLSIAEKHSKTATTCNIWSLSSRFAHCIRGGKEPQR